MSRIVTLVETVVGDVFRREMTITETPDFEPAPPVVNVEIVIVDGEDDELVEAMRDDLRGD